MLPSFPGDANRVRCFAHILNLVAKCIISQFDVGIEKDEAAMLGDVTDLLDLAREMELEESTTRAEAAAEEDDDEAEVLEDDSDDEVDATADLTQAQRIQLAKDALPVKMVLTKVSPFHPLVLFFFSGSDC